MNRLTALRRPATLAGAPPVFRSFSPSLSSASAAFLDPAPDAVPAAPSPSASDLNIRPLSCSFRHRHGSRSSRRLRNEKGLVPGVIYGNVYGDGLSFRTPKISVQTDMVRLYNEMRKFPIEGRVYDLTLEEDGSVHRVVPQGLKADPIVDSEVWCCNFLRYFPGRELLVPLAYVNEDECPAMKRGAFIIKQKRHVTVTVEEGVPVPVTIEVDCSGLVLKQTVRRDRLIIPDGVKLGRKVRSDFLVGSLYGRVRDVIE